MGFAWFSNFIEEYQTPKRDLSWAKQAFENDPIMSWASNVFTKPESKNWTNEILKQNISDEEAKELLYKTINQVYDAVELSTQMVSDTVTQIIPSIEIPVPEIVVSETFVPDSVKSQSDIWSEIGFEHFPDLLFYNQSVRIGHFISDPRDAVRALQREIDEAPEEFKENIIESIQTDLSVFDEQFIKNKLGSFADSVVNLRKLIQIFPQLEDHYVNMWIKKDLKGWVNNILSPEVASILDTYNESELEAWQSRTKQRLDDYGDHNEFLKLPLETQVNFTVLVDPDSIPELEEQGIIEIDSEGNISLASIDGVTDTDKLLLGALLVGVVFIGLKALS